MNSVSPIRLAVLTLVLGAVIGVGARGEPVAAPLFGNDAAMGVVVAPAGQRVLAACSVGVRLTAPSLHLREQPRWGGLAMPTYPKELFDMGATGKCELVFDVTPDDRIENIKIARSTDKAFGEAALAAAKTWKVEPLKWRTAPKTIPVTALFVFSIYYEDEP